MLLGQAIGRLGNFVNQELYGPPTDPAVGNPDRVGEPHRRVDEHEPLPGTTASIRSSPTKAILGPDRLPA